MLDVRIKTLLTVVRTGSFTRAAEELSLTQPAVSHHIRQLEKDFGVKIFQKGKKALTITPEGEILLKYSGRMMSIDTNCRQALEDYRRQVKHLNIGITRTAGENLMTQVLALYCSEHPQTHINVYTDTINNLYDKLGLYELDLAIVEGALPSAKYRSVLFVDLILQIVAPDDAVALIAFSVSAAILSGGGGDIPGLLLPVLWSLLAVGMGVLAGIALHKLVDNGRSSDHRLVLIVGTLLLFTGLCSMLDISPLLFQHKKSAVRVDGTFLFTISLHLRVLP